MLDILKIISGQEVKPATTTLSPQYCKKGPGRYNPHRTAAPAGAKLRRAASRKRLGVLK